MKCRPAPRATGHIMPRTRADKTTPTRASPASKRSGAERSLVNHEANASSSCAGGPAITLP